MKGVTKLVVESVSSLVISTHTPVKGVTVADDHQQQLKYHFNSHAREGRDTDTKTGTSTNVDFNSHAREGRDIVNSLYCFANLYFNSHAREGRDAVLCVTWT